MRDQRAIVGHIEEARVVDRLAQLADELALSWLRPAPFQEAKYYFNCRTLLAHNLRGKINNSDVEILKQYYWRSP